VLACYPIIFAMQDSEAVVLNKNYIAFPLIVSSMTISLLSLYLKLLFWNGMTYSSDAKIIFSWVIILVGPTCLIFMKPNLKISICFSLLQILAVVSIVVYAS
jgi:hypothetical protein